MRMLIAFLLTGISTACSAAEQAPSRLPIAVPSDVGLDAAKLAEIDSVVHEGIDQNRFPGAVVLVVRQGKIAFRKAYGLRRKRPTEAAMTADTVFDLASLTKPVATATSVMLLLEQGKLALADPVAKHLPEFGANGKE